MMVCIKERVYIFLMLFSFLMEEIFLMVLCVNNSAPYLKRICGYLESLQQKKQFWALVSDYSSKAGLF
jgi:hypothetical protein